jgi:hypothetical protein
MHKMTIFSLGNCDCCRIDLACGKKILFDYADSCDREDKDDLRCDLPKELRDDLQQNARDYYDVVAFTHLDTDHFRGATSFFHLEHANKYQGDGRIKINVMWVPACVLTEEGPDDEEARILQCEARHRFKERKGIRVFSRPERLRNWCDDNGIDLDDRLHLITDAGRLAPELSLEKDSVELFVHSPFAVRQDENTVEDRNGDSIVVQATFDVGGVKTKALLMADTPYDALSDIISVTRMKDNELRMEWDIIKLPHHCSYLSLGPDKGEDRTEPVDEVAWLYEKQRQDGGIIVSPSKPIPVKDSTEDDDPNPPHRQAANYYKDILRDVGGQFIVTMEHPTKDSPKPVVIDIGTDKATVRKRTVGAGYVATSRPAPRAG